MSGWEVSAVKEYIGKYKDSRRIIMEAIQQRTDLSIPERLALYEQEMEKLRVLFRGERRSEFESKSVQVSQEHSCTSGSSGGRKDCGWKCATSPSPDLYTKAEWVTTSGTNKGLSVSDSQACIKMTVAGRGRNAGSVTATFRYRPEIVARRVEDDARELFNLITDDVDVDVSEHIDERIGGAHVVLSA
jgi:hypothetical protein